MPNKILTIGSTLNPVDTTITGILTAPTPTSSSGNTQVATKEYVDGLTIISSTDNAVARFNGTNGLLQNSGVLIGDDNLITCPGRINFANGTRYYVTSTGDASFKNLGLGSFERDSGSDYILKLGGNTLVNGTIYLANGTTYYLDSGAVGRLNWLTLYNGAAVVHSTKNYVDPMLFRMDTRAGTSAIGTGTTTDTTIDQSDWAEVRFRSPALRKTYATAGDTSSSYTSAVFRPYFWWRLYSPNSTTGEKIGHYENYLLPQVDADRTTDASYSILTSKSAVTIAQGGTGKTSWTANGLVYASSASALGQLGVGTSGYVLQSNGNAAPSWINATNANTASTIVKRDASGNFSAGTITANLTGVASKATAANITTTANAVAIYSNTTGTFSTKASANGALYATAANGAWSVGALPIAQGGTGKTSASDAWTALGGGASGKHADSYFALASHNHAAGDITSGTLGVARGGTGLTASPSMLTNLGSTSAANILAASPRPGVTGTLPVANGGTGATTLTSGAALIGAGTGAVTTRTITNNIATSTNLAANTNLITQNTLRYHTNRLTSAATADTNYTTYMFRGQTLNSTATNASQNGQIAWQYA